MKKFDDYLKHDFQCRHYRVNKRTGEYDCFSTHICYHPCKVVTGLFGYYVACHNGRLVRHNFEN